jgi:TM2 domain-containing membrane protein YozV
MSTSTTNPELPIVAYCRACGKALTMETQHLANGTVYCADHVPAPAAATPGTSAPAGAQSSPYQPPYTSPYTAPPPPASPYTAPMVAEGTSPGLAFLLGLIPGVGAVYNGQYAKALVHVIIFGFLISSLTGNAWRGLEPLAGMVIGLFYFYMPFEAFHTARRRQLGLPIDEFSSIIPLKRSSGGFPFGPVLMIVLGAIFLLNTFEIIEFYQLMRYWPVALIGLGVYMLWVRMRNDDRDSTAGEMSHESR